MRFRSKNGSHGGSSSATQRRRTARQGASLLFSVLIIFCGIVCGGAQRSDGQINTTAEYKVKAAFLYNFAKFIEWPPQTFPGGNSPIILCVYGSDPFRGELEATVLGKKIDGRGFETRHMNRIEELRVCHMVFVSEAEAKRAPEILAALKDAPLLVVGESQGFAAEGGEIQFVLEDGKVHFLVNTDAVGRAHLKVSSKLLSLAQIVRDGVGGKEN
ncbi:MAG: YfiR family protein [Candidatus Acidiferrales bacterium]